MKLPPNGLLTNNVDRNYGECLSHIHTWSNVTFITGKFIHSNPFW